MSKTPAERIAKAEADLARLKGQQVREATPRPTLKSVPIIEWQNCYDQGWQGLITPESFSHPAKAARGLVVRIFDHLFEIGALTRGSIVCDPFGGIGTTGIEASFRGCPSVSCELEPKFHALQLENVELHRHAWETMGLPIPMYVQGDSRKLREHVREAISVIVSSPPYSDQPTGKTGGDFVDRDGGGYRRAGTAYDQGGYANQTEGQLGTMPTGDVDVIVSSPPFGGQQDQPIIGGPGSGGQGTRNELAKIGRLPSDTAQSSPDNLAVASMGEGVDVIISSPPYAEIASGAGGLNTKPPQHEGQQGGRSADAASQDTDQRYGSAEGQLAKLPKGDVSAVISSPPFLDARSDTTASVKGNTPENMGVSDANLNVASTDTFWSASATILRECFAILKPNGVAVFIVKSFVRGGAIVDFPNDWRRLCEHVGFETCTEVHAMLVKEEKFTDIWGNEVVEKKERKSFFRRLAESKGSPEINYEVVFVMVKR